LRVALPKQNSRRLIRWHFHARGDYLLLVLADVCRPFGELFASTRHRSCPESKLWPLSRLYASPIPPVSRGRFLRGKPFTTVIAGRSAVSTTHVNVRILDYDRCRRQHVNDHMMLTFEVFPQTDVAFVSRLSCAPDYRASQGAFVPLIQFVLG
jgi:hypothetical protein